MPVLNPQDLSHLALNVTDIQRSTDFYRDIVGLQVLFEEELPGGMGFSTGLITPSGTALELIQITGMEVRAKEFTSTIAFSVDSLNDAMEALKAAGVETRNEMEVMGIRMCFFSDPDGHNLEIAEFPGDITRAAQLHGA